MARLVTVQQIIDRARIHADQRGSGFIRDTELLSLMNEVYPELYDELVGAYDNYFVSTSIIALNSSASIYTLPANFYKLLSVDYVLGGGSYKTIYPNSGVNPNSSGTLSGEVRIRYVPAPQIFTSLSNTLDCVSGWDRLLSLLLAIDMADSEETDSTPLYRKYQRTLKRITDMASTRDPGSPATVRDVSERASLNYLPIDLSYRLQGGELEFLSPVGSIVW